MADILADEGAHIALLDMQEASLNQAVAELCEKGITARAYVVNVTSESEVESVFQQIGQDFKQLNGLINSAGIMRDGMLLKVKDGKVAKKMSLEQFQSVLDVNVTGSFLCAREAATQMIELGCEGVLINLSSVSRAGNMGQTNYSASKAAVATMTVTWAKELAKFGIRAACIAPGLVDTAMARQMRPEMMEMFLSTVPLRRLAQVEELGHTAKYIFENDYLTGRVIELDGGTRV
jgi:3-oxoacyl-[acyl-carrier protein] reductase